MRTVIGARVPEWRPFARVPVPIVDDYRDLLQELLLAYGPGGQEDAVRAICHRELEPVVDETWVDPAGNLVGLLRGGDGPPIRVLAHLDELSMLVKRVESDGTLSLTPLGTMYPANFGLGAVTVLGDHGHLCGVLALGSEHTTAETPRVWQTKPDQGDRAVNWPDVYVFTGLPPEELTDHGVGPGTRVVLDRSRRTLIDVGTDYLGSYFMDDRAPLTAMLRCAAELAGTDRPAGDVYFVATTSEEIGGLGGTYAARSLPGDLVLALEVGPTEPEYRTTVAGGPIVAYGDALALYDKAVADRLIDVARGLGLQPQAAVLGAFESDASHAKASGQAGQAALLCLPTLSTHGYEVIARDAIPAMAAVLAGFLRAPHPPAQARV